nr:hypothetical protein DMDDKFKA_00046 [Haslea ostrearia]
MCKVMNFFTDTGYKPILIKEHINRARIINEFADKDQVDLL